MEQVRVLLAHHYPIVRTGLRMLLELNSSVRVVGEAANGREALALAEYQRPAIAVLDLELQNASSFETARLICAGSARTQVICLSAVTDEVYVEEAFKAGARGYVYGNAAEPDLGRAISVVAAGGVFLSPCVCGNLFGDWNDRAKYLFSLLLEGKHEAEIAQILDISLGQVQSELARIKTLVRGSALSRSLFADPPSQIKLDLPA